MLLEIGNLKKHKSRTRQVHAEAGGIFTLSKIEEKAADFDAIIDCNLQNYF